MNRKQKGAASRAHAPGGVTVTRPSEVITKIVNTFLYQSNSALFPAARFNVTRTYVNNVTNNVTHARSRESSQEVILQLLSTALINEEARVMLQDYLLSDEVGFFIRHLVQSGCDVTGLLAGMAEGINNTISRFPGKLHFGVALLVRWFSQTTVSLFQPQPGQLLLLFSFLKNCLYEFNHRKTDPGEEIRRFMDSRLVHLFKHLLQGENHGTINARDMDGNTILHLASGYFHLPNVTRLLLGVPGVEVNPVNKERKTPLVTALECLYISGSGKSTVLLLLDQTGSDVTVLDTRGRSALQYTSHLLLFSPVGHAHVLDVINRMVRHSTMTSPAMMTCVKRLLSWEPVPGTEEAYVTMVTNLVESGHFRPAPPSSSTASDNSSVSVSELLCGIKWRSFPYELQLKLLVTLTLTGTSTDHQVAVGFLRFLALDVNHQRAYFETFLKSFTSHTAFKVTTLLRYDVMKTFVAFMQKSYVTPEMGLLVYHAVFEAGQKGRVTHDMLCRALVSMVTSLPSNGAGLNCYYQVLHKLLTDRRLELGRLTEPEVKALVRPICLNLTYQSRGHETAFSVCQMILQQPHLPEGLSRVAVTSLLTLNPTYIHQEYFLRTFRALTDAPTFRTEDVTLFGGMTLVDYVMSRMSGADPWPQFAVGMLSVLAERSALDDVTAREALLALASFSGQEVDRQTQEKVRRATLAVTNAYTLTLIDLTATFEESVRVLKLPGYPLNKKDHHGNTILYDICSHLETTKVIGLIETLTWDLESRDHQGRNVIEYCRSRGDVDHDVIRVLQEKMDRPNRNQDVGIYLTAVTPGVPRSQTSRVPPSSVLWKEHKPQGGKNYVQPSSLEFYKSQTHLIKNNMVYPMGAAYKGKACIITIHSFEAGGMPTLNGYLDDEAKLADMWHNLGFQVVMPSSSQNRCLTAEEMQDSLKKYACSLTEVDACCVVCVLSHGGNGFVYGQDGRRLLICDIMTQFDDVNCPIMMGRPKIFIVQACSGEQSGLSNGSDWNSAIAASSASPPTISDMTVCYPSLAGLESYVYLTPGRGSLYIESLVKVFEAYACKYDLLTMLTWVKKEVGEKPAERDGIRYKQMPRTETCLTKLLYFFPCPHGFSGPNWV